MPQTIGEFRKIELLPEHLIDQIKAGEVVERPSALVKELLENSMDAGANEIDIHIVDSGLKLISIKDNGDGIHPNDLPLAFARHATSKIKRFDDIYHLESFGFRGEALASISAISRLTCMSAAYNPAGQLEGAKITFEGGVQKEIIPWSAPSSSTAMIVKDLFYNTPARLKFVRSKKSEHNALKRMIYSFILSHPHVSFKLQWDDKDKEIYAAVTAQDKEGIKKRIEKVFFKKNKDDDNQLLEFYGEYDRHRVYGYIAKKSSKSNAGKHHYMYANKRLFTDKSLHQAVFLACEKVWPKGENGHYIAMIEAPSDQIDVNIHPNKTQIKFLKFGTLFSLLKNSIAHSLKGLSSPVVSPPTTASHLKEQKDTHFFQNDHVQRSLSSHKKCTQIYEGYYSFSYEKHSYLLCSANLMRFICKNLLIKAPLSDESLTPLLIASPLSFQNKLKNHEVELLKSIGLDLYALESGQYILRSTPSDLTALSTIHALPHLIELLIDFIRDQKIRSLQQLQKSSESLTQVSFDKLTLSELEITMLIESLDLSTMLKNNIIIKIEKNDLAGLFHS